MKPKMTRITKTKAVLVPAAPMAPCAPPTSAELGRLLADRVQYQTERICRDVLGQMAYTMAALARLERVATAHDLIGISIAVRDLAAFTTLGAEARVLHELQEIAAATTRMAATEST